MSKPYEQTVFKPWKLIASALRFIAKQIQLWPLWVIVFCLVSPVTPHLRISYRYYDSGSVRVYSQCKYLSVHGLSFPDLGYQCPLIAVVDHKSGRRYF